MWLLLISYCYELFLNKFRLLLYLFYSSLTLSIDWLFIKLIKFSTIFISSLSFKLYLIKGSLFSNELSLVFLNTSSLYGLKTYLTFPSLFNDLDLTFFNDFLPCIFYTLCSLISFWQYSLLSAILWCDLFSSF